MSNANPFEEGFLDELEAAATAAESFGIRKNFGQLTIAPTYQRWEVVGEETDADGNVKEKRMPVEISLADYRQTDKRSRSMQLKFSVNIQEFNPELDFQYERNVNVGDKDWRQIFVPSVQRVFGKDSMNAGNYSKTLAKLHGSYVEVHDVPQARNPEYNTIALAKVFGTKDECYAAYEKNRAQFAEGGSGEGATATPTAATATTDIPEGYSEDTWNELKGQVIAELEKGTPIKEVSDNWAIPVPFLAKLKSQA